MSIPSTFSSTEEYLEAAFQFLYKYKWLYCNKNMEVLTKNVLSNFCEDWIVYFNTLSIDDLHDLVSGIVKGCAPLSLTLFIDEINRLKPDVVLNPVRDEHSYCNVGLSAKKSHEIALFAPFIHDICRESGCDLIVDIGCGLGYLPHLLYEKYGSKILGLESSKKFLNLARENQEKQHSCAKNNVVFCEMFVSENSDKDIEQIVEEHFGVGKDLCITGLHACADLSIEVLELFMKMESVKALAIMPCCYHRIKVEKEDETRTYFKNFPASEIMTHAFEKYDAYSFLSQTFLRLACQQTVGSFNKMTKEEHTNHSLQCMNRSILQLVAELENCSVRRLKRKSGKSNATDSDEGFQTYLNNLETTHKLEVVGPSQRKYQIKITDEAFLLKMHEKWNEHKGDCWLVEVLMGLQAAVQSICENVILLDRVEFLKEKGFHCYNRKITNDFVSPRCWALIAKKTL